MWKLNIITWEATLKHIHKGSKHSKDNRNTGKTGTHNEGKLPKGMLSLLIFFNSLLPDCLCMCVALRVLIAWVGLRIALHCIS